MKWLPWKYVVRRIARARGFIDPIAVLARLHQFAEPAEVAAPVELLRAGVVFHARGLMNSGVIQHNMDWIWPFWVERQFDPEDEAFLPRAFSVTHVNLTHRNWTAVGLPGVDHLPIVDPRGLLTPYWDGWSLDGWIFRKDGTRLIPSKNRSVQQELHLQQGVQVRTDCEFSGMHLTSMADTVVDRNGRIHARQNWVAVSSEPASFILALRPYNPEGVSFVHDIALNQNERGWTVGDHGTVHFSDVVDGHYTSDYKRGDVAAMICGAKSDEVHCPVGMATAAAVFRLKPNTPRKIAVTIPLDEQSHRHWLFSSEDSRPHSMSAATEPASIQHDSARDDQALSDTVTRVWEHELQGLTRLNVPNDRFNFLHDAALRTLVLHTPGEVYPGPYTYKRFWVRDTAFILNAALHVGLQTRTEHALPQLFARQNSRGYFHSQDGEWDSNGQALWLLGQYCQRTGNNPLETWIPKIRRAANWICRKRLPSDTAHVARGLLPAGFSAEHLGPNDYYLWDDFWSVAGLNAAASLLETVGDNASARRFQSEAAHLLSAIDASLERTDAARDQYAFPAAPERRMDAGAIGSLVASYPLQLVAADDERMENTLDFLMHHCLVQGGFFQDMIHSGINAYLTLHLAQALLRRGGSEWFGLVQSVAKMASPTGQWPEAIHPRTLGGCMGDGQHAWAAAEWLMIIRNIFVREEGNMLLLGSGIPVEWLCADHQLQFGPTWTKWGKLKMEIDARPDELKVAWQADWHADPPQARLAIHGFPQRTVDLSGQEGCLTLQACFSNNSAANT